MKQRSGFVSNSSSSSFFIPSKAVSEKQIEKIKNHTSNSYFDADTEDSKYARTKEQKLHDAWSIEECYDGVRGSTNMNNFDMDEFLTSIGVDAEDVEWRSD